MFDAEGQMRVATKSTLNKMFQVEVSQRLIISPTAIVMDVSAVWTVDWPSHANVETFISGFKVSLSIRLLEADVHLCFDRYRDYSTKSSTRSARVINTFVHQFDLKTPLPARGAVLKNCANDTDVFALLIFYLNEKLQISMIMQSPIQCRSCVDIKETVHTENHT